MLRILERFILNPMKFSEVSDAIPAILRTIAQSEAEDRAKVEALRAAIQEGFDSGIAQGDVIGRLRSAIRDRAKANRRRSVLGN
jgi:Arc/MetJ-type ribon-helix-helix transcriptional regulator